MGQFELLRRDVIVHVQFTVRSLKTKYWKH